VVEIAPNAPTALTIPTDPVAGATGSWTAKVHSPDVGQWEITFTAEVTYNLWDIAAGSYLRDANNKIETVTFSGEGCCRFKATDGNFKIVLTPADNFAKRSRYRLGVGEVATISVEPIDPNDTVVIATTPGGPRIVANGQVKIDPNNKIQVTALNAKGAGRIYVWAKVNDEPAPKQEVLDVEVVEPEGVHLDKQDEFDNKIENMPISPISNGQPYAANERGAYFFAIPYLRPTDVSFNGVLIGEGTVATYQTGSLSKMPPPQHPAWQLPAQGGNIQRGCRVGNGTNVDHVGFRWHGIGNGLARWKDIPWTYQTGTMLNPKPFTKMTQVAENIGNTVSRISKNGIVVTRP